MQTTLPKFIINIILSDFHHLTNQNLALTPKKYSLTVGQQVLIYISTSVPPFSDYLFHLELLNEFHHLAKSFGGITPIILDCFANSINTHHKASLLS